MHESAWSLLAASSSFLLWALFGEAGGKQNIISGRGRVYPAADPAQAVREQLYWLSYSQQIHPAAAACRSCIQAGSMLPRFYSIPRSLCSCLLNLQLPMLVTVAALSIQPWSSCLGAAFADPPTLGRGVGGGFCVPTTRRQHRWAQFNTLSSTLSVEGRGKLNYSNYTCFQQIYSQRVKYQPSQAFSLRSSSNIRKFSSLRSSQKNSNLCHDYLCIVISVFFTI